MDRKFLALLCCALLVLPGCRQDVDPYRVDTVIQIPLDPTEPSRETEIPEPPQTAPETAEPTGAPEETVPEKKDTGTSGSSGKNTAGKSEPQAPTEAAWTTETAATAADTLAATEPLIAPESHSLSDLEYAIAQQINSHRSQNGLAELELDAAASSAAALRAREAVQLWSHSRPDGRPFTSALSDWGVNFSAAEENLLYVTGEGDAAQIVQRWMNADAQRANILGSFTALGVGVYAAGGVTTVACIFFA